MEKEKKGKKKTQKKEEISGVFGVGSDEEKIVQAQTIEKAEEKPAPQEQIKKENKIFRDIIIVMIGFALMFFVVYLIITSMGKFEVDGVNFQMVKEGDLILYKTSIPVFVGDNKTKADYNFYLRTDPRTLKKDVPLIGNLTFRRNLVLDVTTEDLFCDGDWTIALANMQKLYTLLGFNLLAKNKSIDYEPESEYMFLTINKANQTAIKEITGNAYEMNITNCKVLPAFEKFMLEAFIKRQELN